MFFKTFGTTLLSILPYLIAGIIISELLRLTSWTKIIYKWVSTPPFVSVAAASIIGVISPLCIYGTIPILKQLYKSGVRAAPLITFLAATSIMNPQLFIMTAGGIDHIGLQMALVLTFAVIIISFTLGMLMHLIPVKYIIRKNIMLDDNAACEIINKEKKQLSIKQFIFNCLKTLKSIGFYLFIGIFLSVVIELYIPKTIIFDALGEGNKVRSILLASLMGVPLYACGGGAIPLVNRLIQNGMGKGAGLAFFIVGSATRPAPLASMAALFTPLFIAAYCVFLIVTSVLLGVLYF